MDKKEAISTIEALYPPDTETGEKRACRALDMADRTMERTKQKLYVAEGLADVWTNQQGGNR